MKTLTLFLLALSIALPGSFAQDETPPEVQEWRSKKGSKLKAMILDVDEGGTITFQTYKPTKVPLKALREEDQAAVRAWQKRQAQEKEWIRQGYLTEVYKDPAMSILKESLRKVEKGKLVPYEPKNAENLQVIAFYFNKEFPDDQFINVLSDAYRKLHRRTDTFEVVYVTLGNSEKDVISYIEQKKVEFPVLDPVVANAIRRHTVGQRFKGTYPQLVVVNRMADLLADSNKDNENKSQFQDALEGMEDAVKKAMREQKNPTSGEDE